MAFVEGVDGDEVVEADQSRPHRVRVVGVFGDYAHVLSRGEPEHCPIGSAKISHALAG